MRKYVFTCGDINGIGPEIVIKALNKLYLKKQSSFIFICPANVFRSIIKKNPVNFEYEITDKTVLSEKKKIQIIDIGNVSQKLGTPTIESGKAAYNAIKLSFELVSKKIADGIITAPISKTALKYAGINFPGHTELYAHWCKTNLYAMTFLSPKMNAALITIHEPLKNVPSMITGKLLREKFNIVYNFLKIDMRISEPKIAVLGLNPHAGENGFIGKEEEKIIKPIINEKNYSKYFDGTFSPDAFFANKLFLNYDLVIGNYHDQILIPFKLLNFWKGVNYTAGLPLVRTSPDHGTAFNIAGENIASDSSLLEAYNYAEKIIKNRLLRN